MGDWDFDREAFPDPAAMVRELQTMGIHTAISVWPTVSSESVNYEEMARQGWLIANQRLTDSAPGLRQ